MAYIEPGRRADQKTLIATGKRMPDRRVIRIEPQGIGDCPRCKEFVVYGKWHRCLGEMIMILPRDHDAQADGAGGG